MWKNNVHPLFLATSEFCVTCSQNTKQIELIGEYTLLFDLSPSLTAKFIAEKLRPFWSLKGVKARRKVCLPLLMATGDLECKMCMQGMGHYVQVQELGDQGN